MKLIIKNNQIFTLGFLLAIWSMPFAFANNICDIDEQITPNITGELKEWHKVTLTFDGPTKSELGNDNPFMNYKMDVTFTSPNNEVFVVPGYFAADGNSENSLATSGNKWRAHIAPNVTGVWSYSVSFVTGNDVAVNENVNGVSAGFFDNDTGTFTITATDKTNDRLDHRGKGRLIYDQEHYLKYQGTGEYFIKAGADAPENKLAYEDFDGTTNVNNNRKNWAPHLGDYDAADASDYTWNVNGQVKGKGLLGAIKYLSDVGMNAFSFLTFNVEGDGKNVFPHVKKNPNDNTNFKWDEDYHKLRMDVSKLAQWEKIFEYGDKKGMFMHFKLMEKENEIFMDRDLLEAGIWLGNERKLYYRELIARFGHHLALNWNLGEECDVWSTTNGDGIGDTELESVKEWSRYFKAIDPYNHLIVIHSPKSSKEKVYSKLLGTNSNQVGDLTGASLQTFFTQTGDKKNAHEDVIEWTRRSAANGRKWVVSNDEQGVNGAGGTGVTVDDGYNGQGPDNRTTVRHRALWGTLLAGGAGIEYYYGGDTGCSDVKCQDHRSRENKYLDAQKALAFFHNYLMDDILDLKTHDELTSDNDSYVFAIPGKMYVIYLPKGGSTNLNLGNSGGTYDVEWYDPVAGGDLINDGTISGTGSKSLSAPNSGNDWVALVRNSSTLSINDNISNIIRKTNGFSIYSNPASDLVTIDIQKDNTIYMYSLRIMSAEGKIVKEQIVQQGQTQIDIRNIAPGMYNVMLFHEDSVQSKKLIIVR